jgi:hypothetical protein
MKGLDMPFMHKSFAREPFNNFEEDDTIRLKKQSTIVKRASFLGRRLSGSMTNSSFSLRPFKLEVHTERPRDVHTIYDLEVNEYFETLSCFLWQRSCFYTKAKINVNGWYLSWFTFTHDGVYSVPDRTQSEMHKMIYPPFTEVEVDLDRLILKIPNPQEGKRDCAYSEIVCPSHSDPPTKPILSFIFNRLLDGFFQGHFCRCCQKV